MENNPEEGLKQKKGRGIYALLGGEPLGEGSSEAQPLTGGGASSQELTDKNEIQLLPLSRIVPNPEQPRKRFDNESLAELAQSIARDGVLQPIVVSEDPKHPGRWVLIAGERRLRASKLAGLAKIPAIFRSVDEEGKLRLALIENIQRAKLNIIDEAQAFERLMRIYGLSQQECADRVGKERSTIANMVRLLALPTVLQAEISAGRLTFGHARALLSLLDSPKLIETARQIIAKSLNVRQTERLCNSLKKSRKPASVEKQVNADLEYLAENLRSHLQTKINFRGTAQKGKIEISYFSLAELERLIDLIGTKL